MPFRFLFFLSLLLSIQSAGAQLQVREMDSLNNVAKGLTDFDESNALLDNIIARAQKDDYQPGLTTAVLTKGVNFYNHGRYEDVLTLIKSWEAKILGTKDFAKIAHLYTLRANAYGRLLFFEQSRQSLNRAFHYAQQIADHDTRYYNLGRIYAVIGNNILNNPKVPANLDSLLYYRKKGYSSQLAIKSDRKELKHALIIQTTALGIVYGMLKKNDSAKHFFNRSILLIQRYKLEKYAAESYLGLGDINVQEKELDSALYYYKKSLAVSIHTENSKNIKEAYEKIAAVYEKKGDMTQANVYLKKHSNLADSLALAGKHAVKTSSDLIVNEKEANFADRKVFYTLIITGAVLLLALLMGVLLFLRKRHQKTVAFHKMKQEHLYEKLAYLKEKTLTDHVDESTLKDIIELAMKNDPAFLIKFQTCHPVFIQRLTERAPTLVTTDLLICAQLRLGFYTKEIARYTRASVRAVESKKYRIRKKLNIPATDDLNVWMMQL